MVKSVILTQLAVIFALISWQSLHVSQNREGCAPWKQQAIPQ